jgi:hypothetical protein
MKRVEIFLMDQETVPGTSNPDYNLARVLGVDPFYQWYSVELLLFTPTVSTSAGLGRG